MSTHTYRALESPQHIRLIALHPALSKDAPLRIDFLSSTLDDLEGRYDAISYTWGQPILTFPLYVDDGTQVCVTQNLDRALRYLRYKDRARLLWADAASINQIDNTEKAVQIPLMVKIFRGARKVMAWLDPGGDTTVEERGMHTLSRLSRRSKVEREKMQADLSDIVRFLNLPWFNRIWIIQEVVFNLEIRLICGKTKLAYSRFIAALSFLEEQKLNYGSDDRASMDAVIEVGRLWSRYSHFVERPNKLERPSEGHPERDSRYPRLTVGTETTEILRLVKRFELYGCTDPRDRIFALCSMATDVRLDGFISERSYGESKMPMNIDYSLDVRGTYQAFAVECWKAGYKQTQIWEAILSRQHSARPANWPSWVPDWRIAPRDTWLDWRIAPRETRLAWPRAREGIYSSIPVIMVTRAGTNIITITTTFGISPRHLKFEDLYTVKLKTSRSSTGCQTNFLWQLSRLYILLEKPGMLRNPNYLLYPSASTQPREPETTVFTNLLVDMIRALLPDTLYVESMVELDRHLAKVAMISIAEDPQCSATPPPVHIQEFVDVLERWLEGEEVFCFQDPRTQLCSVGCGNMELVPGDHILPVEDCVKGGRRTGFVLVFILREIGPTDDVSMVRTRPLFRLIGRGYIFDPISVLLDGTSIGRLKRSETLPTEEKAWKEFLSSFGRNESFGWLDLA